MAGSCVIPIKVEARTNYRTGCPCIQGHFLGILIDHSIRDVAQNLVKTIMYNICTQVHRLAQPPAFSKGQSQPNYFNSLGIWAHRVHTAKTQCRKFKTKIPRKDLRGNSPNSFIHVHGSDLYIPLPILLQDNRWTERGNTYVDRSQTHECGN